MAMARKDKEDQLFVRDGRRTYRKQFSLTEFRLGILCLLGLALVAVWVGWRGRNPDPALFSIPLESLQGSMAVDRDPLPTGLISEGWQEGDVSRFTWDDLYVKINGREGFYKSYGFQALTFISLSLVDDPTTSIDIELFDQGSAANALGTYAGERPEEIEADSDDNGMFHRDRNALYITRGQYYIRAIGSDETPVILAQLDHLQRVFIQSMKGADWPWAFELFVGIMKAAPGDLAFQEENAFSFGFANNVWVSSWQDFELFAIPNADEESAATLAGRFDRGFLNLGEVVGQTDGAEVAWVKDRYLGAISGARARDRWVLGVRGAPDVTAAETALGQLEAAVSQLPPDVLAQAWASIEPPPGSAATDAAAETVAEEPEYAPEGY